MLPKVKLFYQDGFYLSKVTIGDRTVITAHWKQDGDNYGDWETVIGECDYDREKVFLELLRSSVNQRTKSPIVEVSNPKQQDNVTKS